MRVVLQFACVPVSFRQRARRELPARPDPWQAFGATRRSRLVAARRPRLLTALVNAAVSQREPARGRQVAHRARLSSSARLDQAVAQAVGHRSRGAVSKSQVPGGPPGRPGDAASQECGCGRGGARAARAHSGALAVGSEECAVRPSKSLAVRRNRWHRDFIHRTARLPHLALSLCMRWWGVARLCGVPDALQPRVRRAPARPRVAAILGLSAHSRPRQARSESRALLRGAVGGAGGRPLEAAGPPATARPSGHRNCCDRRPCAVLRRQQPLESSKLKLGPGQGRSLRAAAATGAQPAGLAEWVGG